MLRPRGGISNGFSSAAYQYFQILLWILCNGAEIVNLVLRVTLVQVISSISRSEDAATDAS